MKLLCTNSANIFELLLSQDQITGDTALNKTSNFYGWNKSHREKSRQEEGGKAMEVGLAIFSWMVKYPSWKRWQLREVWRRLGMREIRIAFLNRQLHNKMTTREDPHHVFVLSGLFFELNLHHMKHKFQLVNPGASQMRKYAGQKNAGLKTVETPLPFDFCLFLLHFSYQNTCEFFRLSAGKILFYYMLY